MTATSILFEKYKVTDIIYESDNVTVYLAEHIHMKAKRIIKKILKKSIYQDSFFSEINVLKSIRHPHIPVIYDIEEDTFAYFIIEEYMEGETLVEHIEKNGLMSEEDAIEVGIKICQILYFLHCQKPIPVLFLDIHPKNILINNDKIFLVDFGSSYFLNEADKRKWLLGAVGFAAPEQHVYGRLDERADIYGIGAVLYFLITGRSYDSEDTFSLKFPNNISEKFKMVMAQCLAMDKDNRFSSVEALLDNLMELKNSDNVHIVNERPLIVSFAGTDRRMGVTHVSLTFAKYLSQKGYKVMYEEVNESNHLRMIAGHEKLRYSNGLFKWDSLSLKPHYGPQVQLQEDCDVIVRDCGMYHKECFDDSHIPVVVAGAKPWEIKHSEKVCKEAMENMTLQGRVLPRFICNTWDRAWACQLWKRLGNTGLMMPYMDGMFVCDDMERKIFGELEKLLKVESKGGEKYKEKTRIFGRIAKKAKGCSGRRNGRVGWYRSHHDGSHHG